MVKKKHENIFMDKSSEEITDRELNHLRAKVKHLSSLIEVSIIINSTLDLDELIELVIEKAQSVMNAEASSVMLLNEKNKVLECKVALGKVGKKIKNTMELKIGEGIAGWVAQHGRPQIVTDVSKDSRFSSKVDDKTGFQTHAILAAPLLVKQKLIGVAEVINRLDGKTFNNDDLELFSTFCRQVAMAIENARMYKLKLGRQKLEQQLEAAKFIQQSFMPESFPNSAGQKFSVAAKSLPATSIGGDFFDFIEFDTNTVGVAIGDVTGKGIPAALYMARLVSDFRINAQIYKYPTQVLRSLNKILVDRSRRGMFVTFQYGILNASNGVFTYANAGHIPIIRLPSNGEKPELIQDDKSVPLGILPNLNMQETSVQLSKGDCIILITDGIIEAKNKSGQLFSLKRTLKKLSHPEQSVEELVSSIIHEVMSYSNNTDQFDDITIVALKWH